MMNKKKLNEVPTVSALKDSEYVVVTMEDGSVGRIKKTSLLPLFPVIKGLQQSFDHKEECRFYVNNRENTIQDAPAVGFFFVETKLILSSFYSIQTASSVDSLLIYQRLWVDSKWKEWRLINTIS